MPDEAAAVPALPDPSFDPTDAHPDPGLDTSVSHSARIWNYWLGGKDNYAADRAAGDKVAAMLPSIVAQARADRAFLGRVIRQLAGPAGIRQFLDIGTGLPTADNTHEVAQRVAPESRIVYVDNDPLVLAHARALLTSTPEGACDYVEGDLHDPDHILAEAARTLDLAQPVGLMLLGILHHIPDTGEAYSIVQRLTAALALFGPRGAMLLSSLVALALAGFVSAMLMSGPRGTYAMAEDGLFFRALARTNALGGTTAFPAVISIPDEMSRATLRLGMSGSATAFSENAGVIGLLASILVWVSSYTAYL